MTRKPRVLIVDRDAVRRAELVEWVEAGGYEAVASDSRAAGLQRFHSFHPEIVVVDLVAAETEGWDLIERMREVARTPIIVSSEDASMEAFQRALDLEVDGFLASPLERETLLGRLGAVATRLASDGDRVYEHDGLKIDWRSCQVTVDGRPVELTGTEFRLLRYLFEYRGWVRSHDQILTEVWGPEYRGERDRVKLYVWYLRRKIELDPSEPRLIATKRGLGYSFVG